MPSTPTRTSPTASAPTRTQIGLVPFHAVDQKEAVAEISRLVESGAGGFIVTPNVDHVVLAEGNQELALAYRDASLSVADGMPILWMARLLGDRLPEKVSGSDLLEPLMAKAAQGGWGVFLFGATPTVSAEAAVRLCERHPGLRIVGRDTSHWNPELPSSSEGVVKAIRDSGASLVVVALGCPKQELWIARHADAIQPAVAIGLGASLDFAAGAVRRAPEWVANAGFEWLFRLCQEPRRLAYRYLIRDARIVPVFLLTLWRRYGPSRLDSPPHRGSAIPTQD